MDWMERDYTAEMELSGKAGYGYQTMINEALREYLAKS
jgi:uncharacterized protein (DUF4415 family)